MTPQEQLIAEAVRRGLVQPSTLAARSGGGPLRPGFAAPKQPDWFGRNIAVPLGATVDPLTGRYSGSYLTPVVDPLAQGATLGFMDEAEALGGATGSAIKQAVTGGGIRGQIAGRKSFSDLYNAAIAKRRAVRQAEHAAHPVMDTALQLVGGLASGAPAQGAVITAPATVSQAVRTGAKYGAGYGAASGFGSAEGGLENRLTGAAGGMLAGAATGAVVPLVAGGIAKALTGQSAITAPTTAQIKAQSQALYDAADQAGLVVAQPSLQNFANSALNNAKGRPILMNAKLYPNSTAAMDEVQNLAAGGHATLEQIDQVRQLVGNAEQAARKSGNDGDARIAGIIQDNLDRYLDKLAPSDVISGDAGQAVGIIKQARGLWARQRKSQLIEDALSDAQAQADKGGSGGNIDNAIRQQIVKIVKNDRLAGKFSPAELGLLKHVTKGSGNLHQLARLLGKMSPEGNGLMQLLQTGSAVLSGGQTLPLAAVGFAAKRLSDATTRGNANAALQAIQFGAVPPARTLTPLEQSIARFLAARGGGMAGGGVGSLMSPTNSSLAR